MLTTYKILSIILLSKLTPYVEEITGNHQFRFQRNRSMTDHIFCICQILEKKSECNEAVHQLCIDFKKAYDSVRKGHGRRPHGCGQQEYSESLK